MVQKLYEASEGVGDSQDLDKSQVSTLKMLFFDFYQKGAQGV